MADDITEKLAARLEELERGLKKAAGSSAVPPSVRATTWSVSGMP